MGHWLLQFFGHALIILINACGFAVIPVVTFLYHFHIVICMSDVSHLCNNYSICDGYILKTQQHSHVVCGTARTVISLIVSALLVLL